MDAMRCSFSSGATTYVQLEYIIFYNGPTSKRTDTTAPVDLDEWPDVDEILAQVIEDGWTTSVKQFAFGIGGDIDGDGYAAGVVTGLALQVPLPTVHSQQGNEAGDAALCYLQDLSSIASDTIGPALETRVRLESNEMEDAEQYQNREGGEIGGFSGENYVCDDSTLDITPPSCPAENMEACSPIPTRTAGPDRGPATFAGIRGGRTPNEPSQSHGPQDACEQVASTRGDDAIIVLEQALHAEGYTNLDVSHSTHGPVMADLNEGVRDIDADTEKEESEGPVLPGRLRRKKRLQACATVSRARSPVPYRKRYRQGKKAMPTLTSPELNSSFTASKTVGLAAVTSSSKGSQPCSTHASNPKRRGRMQYWMKSGSAKTTVRKRSQHEPAWAVDRVVGIVYQHGKLYYVARWEDTLEPAENLQGCADTAIAEFHLKHLL